MILLSLDYETFRNIWGVCKEWDELLATESFRKKAKALFYYNTQEENEAILHLASGFRSGCPQIVKILVSRGINPNIQHPQDKMTPLCLAASSGSKDVVEVLLDAGADTNIPDVRGRTPFMKAVLNGHAEVVKQLLDARVARARDITGKTLICLAALWGLWAVLRRHKTL